MKAVVHRGGHTLDIESRVAEAPAPAKEWGGRGVNVDAIAPGHVATHDTEALRAAPQHDQAILGRIPARRGRGPDDLAGATVFLAPSASDRVNGIGLPVDGGRPGR
ncbi:SDR family oxidoreductase [Streptomyces bottropensis]|uniref:SDR family oxidoreductase n=1 Tax=Streptomyces bottropensis TaxID=42235 RepID=UPI0036AADC4E